jgi:hypothetical protein
MLLPKAQPMIAAQPNNIQLFLITKKKKTLIFNYSKVVYDIICLMHMNHSHLMWEQNGLDSLQ